MKMCFGKYFTFYPGSVFVNSVFFSLPFSGVKEESSNVGLLDQKKQ